MNKDEAFIVVENGGLVFHPYFKEDNISAQYLYLDNHVFDDSHLRKYPIDYFFNNSMGLYNDNNWQQSTFI